MVDDDSVMADAPTSCPRALELQLRDNAGVGGELQSLEGEVSADRKSKDDSTHAQETRTIDPNLLCQFPELARHPGIQTAVPSLLQAARGPPNIPQSSDGTLKDQNNIPRTRESLTEMQLLASACATIPTTMARRSRSNLPKAAVAILKDWLQDHQSNPYPSEDDKLDLAARTGLRTKQINYWFMNARKRILNSGYDSSTSLTDTESLASSTPARGRPPQRVRAVGRNSSTESLSSAYSQSDSDWSRAPKRGRKRRYTNDAPLNNRKRSRRISVSSSTAPGVQDPPSFQCTFCRMSLSEKAWRRHEETQHVPQVYWKCMATRSIIAHSTCAFCGDSVELACLKDHRIAECLARDEKERVFHRKDNLKQHFRYFHDSTLDDRVARAWEFRTEDALRSWTCGFCGVVLEDWNARQVHIAEHFRKGDTMKSWNQDWASGLKLKIYRHEPSGKILPSTTKDHRNIEQTADAEAQVGGENGCKWTLP